MRTIELSHGYSALISDEDYERVVAAGPWRAKVDRRKSDGTIKNVYAYGTVAAKPVALHRFILSVTDSKIQVDHAPDRSGLNCQRENMRLATNDQNQHNRQLDIDNVSGFKGVSFVKRSNKWVAQGRFHGRKNVKLFDTAIEAAFAYDTMAIELYGLFALTNAGLGLLDGVKKPVQSVKVTEGIYISTNVEANGGLGAPLNTSGFVLVPSTRLRKRMKRVRQQRLLLKSHDNGSRLSAAEATWK